MSNPSPESDEAAERDRWLTHVQSNQIRRCFGEMPFATDHRVIGAHQVGLGSYRDPLTTGQLVGALTSLAEVLREHADRARAVEIEREQLVADRAALRRMMGTA